MKAISKPLVRLRWAGLHSAALKREAAGGALVCSYGVDVFSVLSVPSHS